MAITEQKAFAETLRLYLLEFAGLPVKGGALSIDDLLPEGESMSIQMNPGQTTKTYLDGEKKIKQPFTILYRAASPGGNCDRSAMMGILNSVGEWLEKQNEMPFFGSSFEINKMEQIQSATIYDRDANSITYGASYAFEYNFIPA